MFIVQSTRLASRSLSFVENDTSERDVRCFLASALESPLQSPSNNPLTGFRPSVLPVVRIHVPLKDLLDRAARVGIPSRYQVHNFVVLNGYIWYMVAIVQRQKAISKIVEWYMRH